MFSPISEHEILIMNRSDISIFDTRSNTIEKVGTNIFLLECMLNQATMRSNGQVVALVSDETNKRLKAISFAKGDKRVSEIVNFGKLR